MVNVKTDALAARFRVLPAQRGGWRIDSLAGTEAVCATPREAEAVARDLVHDMGGGEILVYDAYLRLRTVTRIAGDALP